MLYVRVENNEVLEITDIYQEEMEEIDADSMDEAIDKFEESSWRYEDYISQKLEEIFTDVEERSVLETYDIKVSTTNRSFNELAMMFEEKDIKIPEVQRKFIWDTNKCSKLIESILIGLPIPPLFFMDNGDNSYEVIDGLQRLTAISNYILGNSWGHITNDIIRKVPAKLSMNVDVNIQGKKFIDLTMEQQKKIRRSTVTVIDFREINPKNNLEAKYLIFERINTGSELLNPMQIRKALAYGNFMSSLYEKANKSKVLKSLYSNQYLNKDRHVEFMLGVYVVYKVLKEEYTFNSQYQKYILNDFCSENKDVEIEEEFVLKFDEYLEKLLEKIGKDNIFKKVNQNGDYHGIRNTNISEVLLATAIQANVDILDNIEDNYKNKIAQHNDDFVNNKINNELLQQRYTICKEILECV